MFSDALIVTYLLCHLVGVSSACTNPILYGLLNFNYLAEHNIIMEKLKVMKNGQKSNEMFKSSLFASHQLFVLLLGTLEAATIREQRIMVYSSELSILMVLYTNRKKILDLDNYFFMT